MRPTHFPYVPTKGGKSWHAWTAGDCWWGLCHGEKRSTACAEWLSDGAVPCDWCAADDTPHTQGYQPLYRCVDSKPCMVILYEDVRPVVDALKLHTRVVIGREEDATATVWVAAAPIQTPRFQTTLPQRMVCADPTTSLLAVWKNPALAAWYAKTHGVAIRAGRTPVSPPVPPPTTVGPVRKAALDSTPMTPGLMNRIDNLEDLSTRDLFPELAKRAAELSEAGASAPPKNGKPKR